MSENREKAILNVLPAIAELISLKFADHFGWINPSVIDFRRCST